MKELHIGRPTQPYSLRVPPPSEERTHLPAEISNLTLDQALDMVAATWNGIILYGACSEPGMYNISYAPEDLTVWSWPTTATHSIWFRCRPPNGMHQKYSHKQPERGNRADLPHGPRDPLLNELA